jgi:hypothetical protein
MRCICVVHLSTMLDSSTLVDEGSGIVTYDAFFLIAWLADFVNLRSLGGWVWLLGLRKRGRTFHAEAGRQQ